MVLLWYSWPPSLLSQTHGLLVSKTAISHLSCTLQWTQISGQSLLNTPVPYSLGMVSCSTSLLLEPCCGWVPWPCLLRLVLPPRVLPFVSSDWFKCHNWTPVLMGCYHGPVHTPTHLSFWTVGDSQSHLPCYPDLNFDSSYLLQFLSKYYNQYGFVKPLSSTTHCFHITVLPLMVVVNEHSNQSVNSAAVCHFGNLINQFNTDLS
jgi:hypothetical protein